MTVRYPLATPSWGPEEYRAIQRVVDSGMFSMGKEVFAFEEQFARHVGSKHAVMVNSGSSANLLAVAVMTLRKERPLLRGDEVIVPAVSWSTTYAPFQQYGMKLVFVDVDPHTLNFDLDGLAAAVTDRTRAIMAVNLLGNPNDFDRIRAITGKRDIVLLEDNCESMGALFGGKQAGTFGLMGTFSSFFSHHISTMEGGVLVTDDEECWHLALSVRAHGWTRNLPEKNLLCTKAEDPFLESFRFILPGYNLRPLEMSGAIGQEQMRKLPEFVRVRRENAAHFLSLFGDDERFAIQREIGQSSWFGFSLVRRDGRRFERKDVVQRLRANGIECRPVVCGNFARHAAIAHFDHVIPRPLVNADRVHDHGLFVGNNQVDIREQIDGLHRALADLS